MSVGKPYQSQRQLMWLEIRKCPNDFTVLQISKTCNVKPSSTRAYIVGLMRAGFIHETSKQPNHLNRGFVANHYQLIKDVGYTAPEVTERGTPTPMNIKNKAMWNTLRITNAAFTSKQLAQFASTPEHTISHACAATYLSYLHTAGYLSKTGQKYQLLKKMNTGSMPPAVKKNGQVFDPNINTLMGVEK